MILEKKERKRKGKRKFLSLKVQLYFKDFEAIASSELSALSFRITHSKIKEDLKFFYSGPLLTQYFKIWNEKCWSWKLKMILHAFQWIKGAFFRKRALKSRLLSLAETMSWKNPVGRCCTAPFFQLIRRFFPPSFFLCVEELSIIHIINQWRFINLTFFSALLLIVGHQVFVCHDICSFASQLDFNFMVSDPLLHFY